MYQEVQERLKSRPREFRAADVRLSQADIGKASRLLGYRPVQTVSEGLARTLGWYVANLAPRRSVRNEIPRPEAATQWLVVDSVRRDTDFVFAVAK
jgi:dTDP-D-glucose 4,6-dehydratase